MNEEELKTEEVTELVAEVKKKGRKAKAAPVEVAATPAVPATPAVVRKAHWPEGFVPSGDRIKDTKAILDAEPKVSFMCPLAPGEKMGAEEIVQINGWKLTIKKNHLVQVPKSVADMLANKYQVEVEVAQRAQAMATREKAEALS